jgi:hypothetical protein
MIEEKVIKDWFKQHKATLKTYRDDKGNTIEYLRWSQPESSFYKVEYFREGGTLFVGGDLGSAVYRWYGEASLEWISKCDLRYFEEKCEASEEGRDFKHWDPGVAEKEFKRCVKEEENKEVRKNLRELLKWGNLNHQPEWIGHLYSDGDKIDLDTLGRLAELGTVIAPRCQSHLMGLKLAFKQLKSAEVAK